MKIAVIIVSVEGAKLIPALKQDYKDIKFFSTHELSGVEQITKIKTFVSERFADFEAWVFVGAMGICVRSIAPLIEHKYHDPAVINIDSTGRYVVSVLSGHIGGANELTKELASTLGAEAVISTQTDNTGLWALDLFSKKYGWTLKNLNTSL